jgi:hypothetical protein
MECFTYDPLSDPACRIRILHLQPSNPHEPIKCTVVEAELHRQLEYEAISYTWGKENDTRPILIDGKCLHVPPNTFNALQDLRHVSKVRQLWIDAICINQKDNNEKEHQVLLMGKIYNMAKQVVIWLEIPRALNRKEDPNLVHDLLEGLHQTLHISRMLGVNVQDIFTGEEAAKPQWLPILRFLHHPYFTRTWTFQEAVLAKTLFVMYGHRELSWDLLYDISSIVSDQPAIFDSFYIDPRLNIWNPDSSSRPAIFHSIQLTELIRRTRKWGDGDDMTLEKLVRKCYSRVAADPRDAIYALLGLATDTERLGLRPSYEASISDVFRVWTEKMMTSSHSLRLLLYVDIDERHQSQNLPSWVPYLGIKSNKTPLFAGGKNKSKYKAGGVRSASFSISDRVLRVKALVTGHVATMTPCLSSTVDVKRQDTRRPAKDMLNWITAAEDLAYESMSLPSSTAYPLDESASDESASTAFWRTLIANRNNDGSVPESKFELKYAMFRRSLASGLSLRPKSRFKDAVQYGETIDILDWPEEAIEGESGIYKAAFLRSASERRFCVTNEGIYGLIPKAANPGDMLVVLQGVAVPFVVRQIGTGGADDSGNPKAVKLIGECYLHSVDIMDGSLWKKTERNEELLIH